MFYKTKDNWYLNLQLVATFNIRRDGYGKCSVFAYSQNGENWWIIASFDNEDEAEAYLAKLISDINSAEQNLGK